jgi:hypothetical protein
MNHARGWRVTSLRGIKAEEQYVLHFDSRLARGHVFSAIAAGCGASRDAADLLSERIEQPSETSPLP